MANWLNNKDDAKTKANLAKDLSDASLSIKAKNKTHKNNFIYILAKKQAIKKNK